jgi:DNA-binding transcriptional MerR regulator
MGELWRIEELAEWVSRALETAPYGGQDSARVRSIPDVRTIRYYTTIGLVAKPAEMRGRTALYGRRHVLQLVAIKKLQARGLSLVEVQQSLAGMGERKLWKLAELPEDFFESTPSSVKKKSVDTPGSQPGSTTADPARRGDSRFWLRSPSCPEPQDAAPPNLARPAMIYTIAPGVSLLVDGDLVSQLGDNWLSDLQPAFEALGDSIRRLRK